MSAKVLGGLCLYSVIMTAATAILAWYGTSCGIESNIDEDENKVKIRYKRECSIWTFHLLEKDLLKSGNSARKR